MAALLAAIFLVRIVWLGLPSSVAAIGWAGVVAHWLVEGCGLAWAVGTIAGSQRHRSWARWLGMALMALLFVAGLLLGGLALLTNGVGELDVESGGMQALFAGLAMAFAGFAALVAVAFPTRSRAWLRGRGRR